MHATDIEILNGPNGVSDRVLAGSLFTAGNRYVTSEWFDCAHRSIYRRSIWLLVTRAAGPNSSAFSSLSSMHMIPHSRRAAGKSASGRMCIGVHARVPRMHACASGIYLHAATLSYNDNHAQLIDGRLVPIERHCGYITAWAFKCAFPACLIEFNHYDVDRNFTSCQRDTDGDFVPAWICLSRCDRH